MRVRVASSHLRACVRACGGMAARARFCLRSARMTRRTCVSVPHHGVGAPSSVACSAPSLFGIACGVLPPPPQKNTQSC
eukprot:8785923-Alexandrium_andersonii.AAC.1